MLTCPAVRRAADAAKQPPVIALRGGRPRSARARVTLNYAEDHQAGLPKKPASKAAKKGASKPARAKDAPRAQVAALPVFTDEFGERWVLLITSRETKRWIIPKGWPMRGRKDFNAAAQEALEEAGIIGQVGKEPVGRYAYWKRQTDFIELCEVDVYRLDVTGQLETWREKGQRETAWFRVDEAAIKVDEPGLRDMIRRLK
jgi:8-oxo-dGTP pyrophosphatase MutT (NUDIX family)